VLLQYPGVNGNVRDYKADVEAIKAKGAMVVAAALLALTMLTPPGEWGADVVVGNAALRRTAGLRRPARRLHGHPRRIQALDAGRLVGVTIDAQGNKAYRLALQTREQHIRREKATSNICTAQVLLAVMASMYAVYHGPKGLQQIAKRVHRLTGVLASNLKTLGYTITNDTFFDTLTVSVKNAEQLHASAHSHGVNLRVIDATHVGVSLDETTTREDIALLWTVFSHPSAALPTARTSTPWKPPSSVVPGRAGPYSRLPDHPVFNRYHSETEMLRYLRSLADKDLALDRTMIPLGSCTMKLNATSEMIPVTWPEFSTIHPFAPEAQTVGYREMIASLEEMLCAVDRLRRHLAAA
jgi:glycine dehydrogenase